MQIIDENYEGPYFESRKRSDSWYSHYSHYYKKFRHIDKFLLKNINRKWSEVYSELCHKYTNDYDRHCLDSWALYRVQKPWGNFEIIDGILKYHSNKTKKYKCRTIEEDRMRHGILHKDNVVYGKCDGIWYRLELKQLIIDINYRFQSYDVFLKTCYHDRSARMFYYGDPKSYCVKKHQLNSKELKELGLKNDKKDICA